MGSGVASGVPRDDIPGGVGVGVGVQVGLGLGGAVKGDTEDAKEEEEKRPTNWCLLEASIGEGGAEESIFFLQWEKREKVVGVNYK